LECFERLVGNTLQELGYSLGTGGPGQPNTLSLKATRLLHRSFFASKFWFKNSSWVRALRPALASAEIDAGVLAEDHPPVLKDRTVRCP